jgi:Zn-dependent protease
LTILVHELGHAFVAKRFRLEPVILIHAFGGITSYIPKAILSRSAAVRITMAGPIAGLLLALVGLATLKLGPYVMHHSWSPRIHASLLEFVQINGFWSLINLLPVMPFDGGQILAYLLGPMRQVAAARISLAFGCLSALVLFRLGLNIAAAVFFVASILQYLAVRRAHSAPSPTVPARQVENVLAQARHALFEGDHDSALRLARAVVEMAPTAVIRRQAAEVYAWSALGKNQLAEARQAFIWMSDGAVDPLLQAAFLEADGDPERAVHCLRQARAVGDTRPQVAASLVRLLLVIDRFGEAALTTIQILDHVTEDEARQVVQACRNGGRPVPAAELAEAVFAKTGLVEDLLACIACYLAAGNRNAARSTLALALSEGLSPDTIEACAEWSVLAVDTELVAVLQDARSSSSK